MLLICAGICSGTIPTYAQSGSFLEDTNLQPYTAGGSLSITAGAYTVDGIPNRRAPGLIQTNANMNFSLFGLQSGLNLAYSTDDNSLRQNMNTLSYNATWRWLTVQAGDVTPGFSEFGLNGTTIRGGYLAARPGNFTLELAGGRSKRAVRPSYDEAYREPSFEQWAAAGKVGFGQTTSSYFHFSTFYAIDEVSSLKQDNLDIEPRENLTFTPDFNIHFFDGIVTLGSQVTFSALTRNLNSTPIPIEGLPVPAFITNMYKPRSSSRLNFAGNAIAGFTLDPVDLTVGYERIQPGFQSLGRGRTRDDQQKITFNPSLRLFNDRLGISSNISLGRDNLLGNRMQTQKNTSVGTNVQLSVTESLMINTSYNLMVNNVRAEEIDGELQGINQSQVSHNFMVQPNLTIIGDVYTHNISLSGSYLAINSKFDGDQALPQNSVASTSITTMGAYTIGLPNGLTLNNSLNFMVNESGNANIKNIGVNTGVSYTLFNSDLTFGLNGGMNRNVSEQEMAGGEQLTNRLQQLSLSLNTSYRLTGKDSFTMTIRTRQNKLLEGTGSGFTELEGNIRYQHTF